MTEAEETVPRRLYLVGFMGCGKTTIGRCLARARGWAFVDLDREIETTTGKSVSELFAELGEEGFRALERAQLERTVRTDRTVVATGGGAYTLAENVETIRRLGTSVWLDLPWEGLARRLERAGELRPLYRDPEQAKELWIRRLPWYRQADLRVCLREGDSPARSARRVLRVLEREQKGIMTLEER